jgi:sensor c-di-GMP phosphodiesterase-like protein
MEPDKVFGEQMMGKRHMFRAMVIIAPILAIAPPWLVWRESQRQAYAIEAASALGYAHDVLHRADETSEQALDGIAQLAHSGFAPCSPELRVLMRRVDLNSTYIQAIGYVQDGVMHCSSLGESQVPLGPPALRTSTGDIIYANLPPSGEIKTELIAIEHDHFAALVHRDLMLDTWTAVPGVSRAVMHLERSAGMKPLIHRGFVDVKWLARLDHKAEVTFVDGGYLVAVVRSRQFLFAAMAAIPLNYLQSRRDELAIRFVPAGLFAGLIIAAASVMLARRQMSIPAALRTALRRGEFFLLYQPIVDLEDGRWVGCEALLRWRRPGREALGPDFFIPIAEQSGIITQLTERVLELIEHDASHFLADRPDFHIAVNLSAADLGSVSIIDALDRFLEKSKARPSNLMVEITERGFLEIDAARAVIAALRLRGIEVAIDDFGTGYSSLSYLESLDLDFLKIDRSFVEAVGTRAPTNQVVGHIIAMASGLGLKMIAEGVETVQQAAFLKERGVQYAQGWLFGQAVTFDVLLAAMAMQCDKAAALAQPHIDHNEQPR